MTTQRSNRPVAGNAAVLPSTTAATGFAALLRAIGSFITRTLATAVEAERERRATLELARLSNHALRDIGLHRSEIQSVTHNAERFQRRRHARI